MKRKKVYFITVVIGFAICMVGVIFGSRLVFQRTCERRTTPWSDLGTADDDEYRILKTSRGSGTVNKRLTNCEQIFEKNRMASNENS